MVGKKKTYFVKPFQKMIKSVFYGKIRKAAQNELKNKTLIIQRVKKNTDNVRCE